MCRKSTILVNLLTVYMYAIVFTAHYPPNKKFSIFNSIYILVPPLAVIFKATPVIGVFLSERIKIILMPS